MAGAKMTDSDTKITEYRPTKLAKRYTELYETVWRDAFAELHQNENKSDEEVIQILLESFVKIYNDCKEEAESQLEKLQTAVTPFHMSREDLPKVIKPLKDKRKKFYKDDIKRLETIANNILQSIPFTRNENKAKFSIYLKKSLKLCWLMVIEDPPVFVDCNTNRIKGQPLDKNLFREYTLSDKTASGQTINFVVLPALYLQKGGALLCKGVAQGQKITHESKEKKAQKETDQKDLSKSLNQRDTISSSASDLSISTSRKTEPKQGGFSERNSFHKVKDTSAENKLVNSTRKHDGQETTDNNSTGSLV